MQKSLLPADLMLYTDGYGLYVMELTRFKNRLTNLTWDIYLDLPERLKE